MEALPVDLNFLAGTAVLGDSSLRISLSFLTLICSSDPNTPLSKEALQSDFNC